MNYKLAIPSFLFVIILALSLIIIVKDRNIKTDNNITDNNSAIDQAEMIFYYGETCPHCKIVEEFMDKNKITEKMKIVSKEVYNNKQNSEELVAKAKICGLSIDNIGVPFFWDSQKCLIGDQPIIDFLKQRTDAK